MARKITEIIVSDLSGDEIDAENGETVEFSYRGQNYSIDLTEKEAAGFDKAIAMYVEHADKRGGGRSSGGAGRRGGRGGARRGGGGNREELQAMREWARANGYEVSERGRISSAVREAYEAANS